MRYYLLNDTRYRNDHGCLTVISNLMQAMQLRGAEITGALPTGQGPQQLAMDPQLDAADLIIVNGEGTLRGDTVSSTQLMNTTRYALERNKRVVLINALWQDNDTEHWRPVLEQLDGIWCRDRRSQKALREANIHASYAPDLTFLSGMAARRHEGCGERYGFTDSIVPELSARLLNLQRKVPGGLYLPMVLSRPQFLSDKRQHGGSLRRRLYPSLYRALRLPVHPYYRGLPYASPDISHYMAQLHRCRAVMSARYHNICFCLQQGIPWLGVRTGSWKIDSLLEEVGLPAQQFLLKRLPRKRSTLENALEGSIRLEQQYLPQVREFNSQARAKINRMFDQLCPPPARG